MLKNIAITLAFHVADSASCNPFVHTSALYSATVSQYYLPSTTWSTNSGVPHLHLKQPIFHV